MPIGDVINVTARQMIERHGASALGKAKLRLDACVRQGHHEAAATWRRIVVVIDAIANNARAAGEPCTHRNGAEGQA